LLMMTLLIVMITAYVAGALGALLFDRGAVGRGVAALGTAIGSATGLALGLTAILSGEVLTLAPARLLPLTGLVLRLDGLSACFLIIIGLIGLAVGLYGFSYSASYEGRYSLRMLGTMLNVLLLSLSAQVIADNALTFLIAWETMSLSAYWLVLTEHKEPEAARASVWYIAMTHAGFAALAAMFLLMSGGDLTTSFAGMRANGALLSPALRNVIFVLALFGFGTKAGIVPLHVWLPMAHPVAPSHVSALMSGVVIKMGIYGLVRIALDLLGGGPAWWGGVVLGVGAVSALASAFPADVAAVVHEPTEAGAARLAELRQKVESFPRQAALKRVVGRRGVPVGPHVRPPLRDLDDAEQAALEAWLEEELGAAVA